MRTLLIGALAATLVGCNCLLPPQAGMESCTDASRFACFDRAAASQPIEPEPALFKTNSATTEINSTIAANTEKLSPAHARDKAHLAMKTPKSPMISAKVEPPASRIPLPPRSMKARLQPTGNAAADSDTRRANIADLHPPGGAVANSNTSTTQEQLAATTAVAEQVTAATPVPAPQQKAITIIIIIIIIITIRTVPITRKPCSKATLKRPRLRRQTTRTIWLPF